tara:strand:- start:3740 stop:4093 length:354 start_codon:yes stop_codon:yes gene_type:complete
MIKSKAAVLHRMTTDRPYSLSNPLRIEEVNLDPPGFREVMVKVKAAGLCHSDLSVIDGNRPRPLPMVLGHEAAGEVVIKGATWAFGVGIVMCALLYDKHFFHKGGEENTSDLFNKKK